VARERNVRSKRKRCKVYITKSVMEDYGKNLREREVRVRCEDKIKPGTPFCKGHFETHKLVEMKCTGENHPYGDHCGVCMPFWGHYPVAVEKTYEGPLPDWKGAWE
jgi:hypothetical protein